MNFADVEREFIRQRILPDFEWATFDEASSINRLRKPLPEARVALVTTGGAYLDGQLPFAFREKTGDSSYRPIPADTPLDSLRLSHAGYNTAVVSADINCVFPLERLRELWTDGIIGGLTQRHFSFMGYIPIIEQLMSASAPAVAGKLRDDGADIVVLVPA